MQVYERKFGNHIKKHYLCKNFKLKTMKKLLTVLFLFIGLSVMADEIKNYLVVWAKDGSKTAYALIDKPKVTFTENELIIFSKGVDVNFPLDDMDRFTYEVSDITAIRDLKTDEVKFKMDGESLLFPALRANSSVSIYTLDGHQIFKKEIQIAGEYSFPLSNLNAGVYLVKLNGLTYKIVKK